MLVWAAACGSETLSNGPGDQGGRAGAAGASSSGGSGGVPATSMTSEPTCPDPACTCDSSAVECQDTLANLCLGPYCPLTLDEAMLVASWPLTASTTPYTEPRVEGWYTACPDGSRTFSYTQDHTEHAFYFDAAGQLAFAMTAPSIGASCAQFECAAPGLTISNSGCYVCQMYSDPSPGVTLTPQPGQYNGPEPTCAVDGYGRWFMPYLDKAN